jgi:hypothetical protein
MKDVTYDIKQALRHYRYLAAFIENAVDAMDWYVDDYKVSSQIRAITESRLETMTYKAHMDRALETYKQLCQLEGNVRPYQVIVRKYVDPAGGSDGKGKPFTNEQLAEVFETSHDTIQRDLREACSRLRILFFGINGLEQEKHADLCVNHAVDTCEIMKVEAID